MANGIGAVVTPRVLQVIGGVVTAVWVASIGLDAFNPAYDPPAEIGLAFMAMLSAILGAAAVRGKDDSKETERQAGNREQREEDSE